MPEEESEASNIHMEVLAAAAVAAVDTGPLAAQVLSVVVAVAAADLALELLEQIATGLIKAVAAADLEALGKTAAVAAYLGMAMEALAATAELEVLGEAATELPEQQERPEGQGHQALLS